MGEKPNAKKKTKKLSQAEQSERFKEAARNIKADETGQEFEKVMKRIIRRRAASS
jgi:hypothetical protein